MRWAVQWWEGANRYGVKECADILEAGREAAALRKAPNVTTVQVIAILSDWRRSEEAVDHASA